MTVPTAGSTTATIAWPNLSSGTPTTTGSSTATITVSSDNFPPSASTALTINVDLTAPTTTDNVPVGFRNAPIPVTLTATDTGAAGVQTTTFEILSAGGTPGATQTYNPAAKPALANGEKIRYRSTDTLGNAEGDNAGLIALANLRDARLAAGGTRTFIDQGIDLLGNVGAANARASAELDLRRAATDALAEQRDGVSGVSTEDELIKLGELQRAHQMSTRFLSVVDELYQDLLNRL